VKKATTPKKTVKTTVKKAAKPVKTSKSVTVKEKKKIESKTAKVKKAGTASKTVNKPNLRPLPSSGPADKPLALPVQQNLGLPDGSEYQPSGQRRPLIVFPK
jgi:hypothetical protein